MAIKDETGKTYGELLVLSYHSRSEGVCKHPRFLCKCSCGNEVVVIGSNLRRNHTTSCGHDKIKKFHKGRDDYFENHVPDELIGVRFGRVVVESFAGWHEGNPQRTSLWKCLCDCGKVFTTRREYFTEEYSCGCWRSEKISESSRKHGMHGTPTHKTWTKMRERCNAEYYVEKDYYQDRGITVCAEWDNSERGFQAFFDDMGERPDGKTLDRIDPDEGYSKENCKWSDLTIQAFNRRPTTNTSGRVGVILQPNGLYRAQIGYYKEIIRLGSHLSFSEACKIREEAELKYYGFTKTDY